MKLYLWGVIGLLAIAGYQYYTTAAGPRKLIVQTLHYAARPHTHIRREPITGPSAWVGTDLQKKTDLWFDTFTDADVSEIKQSINKFRATNAPLRSMRKDDFALPTVGPKITAWRRNVLNGVGFQVIRGFPMKELTEEDAKVFHWALGHYLGVPGAQNPAGDLLGRVAADRTLKPGAEGSVRQYRTREDIGFHCDFADIVGLLCVRQADVGGASRLVSSVTAYNRMLKSHPHLIDSMYEPHYFDTRGDGGIHSVRIRPMRYTDRGGLRTLWHAGYMDSALTYKHVPEEASAARELLTAYNDTLHQDDMVLHARLEPGDIILVSNHITLHARGAYEDKPGGAADRLLLRLWISVPQADWNAELGTGDTSEQFTAVSSRLYQLGETMFEFVSSRLESMRGWQSGERRSS